MYKVILSFWVCVVGRVLSAQNKKCISLQYLQKNMGDEVEFLPQINTNIFYKLIVSFWVCRARHAQSTLNNKFPISKDNSFPQIDNMILMGMIILMGILKVLKVTSLQYLYNIPKKKSGREFMFLHASKHQSFWKVYIIIFDESDQTCPEYPK